MCGIMAYTGYRQSYPVLLKMLSLFEDKVFESADFNSFSEGFSSEAKRTCLPDEDQEPHYTRHSISRAGTGIAHICLCEHRPPADHYPLQKFPGSCALSVVFNGEIENYKVLKDALIRLGRPFEAESQTELLVQLILNIQEETGMGLTEVMPVALAMITGSYSFVIMSDSEPGLLIAAQNGQELQVGISKGEYFVSTQKIAVLEFTKEIRGLNDLEIAYITSQGLLIKEA